MINRNDQHAREPEYQLQVTPARPLNIGQLLRVAALAGVPVARFVNGRAEIHEPPTPRGRRADPVLAPAPGSPARRGSGLSPRFLPEDAPEAAEEPRSEPEPLDFEARLAESERTRRGVRRRLRG